ncbi:energy-coupled thiamine transporter ThiT [Heyndrickxia acidiproducens]|uniref:energy-coupled thiamine transporter ThiT n=1 Tax=Heyndrickxia acidiproducens TaxID=1121084 RepID=UPI00035D21A2|nr:energy-coupled thiamine transporter ThiT [Heyndrickxia acidiproducens]
MKTLSLQAMIEAAIFAAFAMVLDMLPSVKVTSGISLSFAMLPVFVIAFRWGLKAGLASGFVWSLLQLITGDARDILNPVQGILEYPVAFSFTAFAGLLTPLIRSSYEKGSRTKMSFWICMAVLLGSAARYFWHFIAGIVFWGSYAPPGQSAFMYSLILNGGTMIGNAVLCAVLSVILFSVAPQLLTKYQHHNRKAA